jgi:hypothetical protein
MAFATNLVATFIAFAGVIALMAVGLILGGRAVRRGCGNPHDCQCGASECGDAPDHINRSVSQ